MGIIWDKGKVYIMLKSKRIDFICIIFLLISIVVTMLFMNGETLGIKKLILTPPYALKLFNENIVHTIDIIIDKAIWDEFLDNAKDESYINCKVMVDGELFENVGIRTKGNNSLNLISRYNSRRFNFKIEFDHYDDSFSYYGLDKLSLNSSFQDNAYLKDYMTYDMMEKMGVPSPLCSYSYVTVNKQDFGLYVAIEEIENSFAKRNFGKNHGLLYKPEYWSLDDENADVALIYTNDNFDSYENIFLNAKFDISDNDKKRLINSLKELKAKKNIPKAIDVEKTLRYFTVQTFVVNLDSYLGRTGHNYYLYEKDGKLSMLPWDYNLAYATYALGISNPINDSNLFVNYPIDTPASLDILEKRPMFYNLISNLEYLNMYHSYFKEFIEIYFNSGYFSKKVSDTKLLIAPYVKKDPTKFCSYEDFLMATKTYENFCNLRAMSVEKQILGIIPRTFEGQLKDKSKFIDASNVWVPLMGDLEDMEKLKSQ